MKKSTIALILILNFIVGFSQTVIVEPYAKATTNFNKTSIQYGGEFIVDVEGLFAAKISFDISSVRAFTEIGIFN